MSDAAPSPHSTVDPCVYQLRVVLAGISPLIWRRLLIPADTTIAGLHAILQAAFGWSGEHLHRFVIHGREYGIAYCGGPGFREDARTVRLGGLGLRATERFCYYYDFTDGWCHDLRLEQILPAPPGWCSPWCVACRPGHPQLLAGLGARRWVVGLPGNPFAALVAAYTLLAPLLAGLSGRRLPQLPQAPVTGHVRPAPGLPRLIPVAWEGGVARVIGGHRAAFLRGAALAEHSQPSRPAG